MWKRGEAESDKQIIQELDSLQQIMHLTHHRNRNQHRTSKWYKSFGQIRRQVTRLRQAMEILVNMRSLSNQSDGIRERQNGEETQYEIMAQKQIVERGQFIRRYLVYKCYRSFSNLIADSQYAVLGLMLIGHLARMHSILQRLLGPEDETDQIDEKEEQNAEEDASTEKNDSYQIDDSGEVISRKEFQSRHVLDTQNGDAAKHLSCTTINTKKRQIIKEIESGEKSLEMSFSTSTRKKKRKKNDIFDELFSGLL